MDDQATSILPAREQRPLVLCVIKVRDGSDLRVGQVFETRSTPLLIGRDARADVRLNDRTVSRQHARLEADGNALRVVNLSKGGTTMVNRARVAPGEAASFSADEAHIQVGGVLLRVTNSMETTAFDAALSMSEGIDAPEVSGEHARPEPLLSLAWDAGHCHVRLRGRLLSPYPATAAVLAALCETPGEPVHRFDLEEALGEGGNLEQQVSLIRRMFADEIEGGTLSLDVLRRRVRAHSTGPHLAKLDAMDTREVLRYFVASKRGYGYVICLGTSDVAQRTEGV